MSARKERHAFGCSCRTHVARAWNRPEHWSRAEVDYLETWFGRRTDESISRALGRSVVGLRLRAKRLGLRKRDQGMTGRAVAAIFGVESSVVGKVWVRRGFLRSAQTFRQGPHLCHLIDPADVERFIREHGEYVDVERMPESPYRDLAAREPWVGTPEIHRLTGRSHHAVTALIAAGTIRGRKRGTHWYVPLADVALIRPLHPDHLADSRFRRASNLEQRRNRRKLAA